MADRHNALVEENKILRNFHKLFGSEDFQEKTIFISDVLRTKARVIELEKKNSRMSDKVDQYHKLLIENENLSGEVRRLTLELGGVRMQRDLSRQTAAKLSRKLNSIGE